MNSIKFPPNSADIIRKLVKKYEIEDSTENILQALKEGKNFDELPGRKIANLLREIKAERLKQKDLYYALKEELNLSEQSAIDMAKELDEKILSVPIEEKSETSEISNEEEKEKAPESEKKKRNKKAQSPPPKKETKKSKSDTPGKKESQTSPPKKKTKKKEEKEDIYREPIE